MAGNTTSLWQRIKNLLRTKTTQQVEKYETPDVVAHQTKASIDENVRSLKKSVAESIGNLRTEEGKQSDRMKELEELETKVEATRTTILEMQNNNGSAEEIRLYTNLLEGYVNKYNNLVQVIEDTEAYLAPLRSRVEILKEEFTEAVNDADQAKSQVDMMLVRATTASSIQRAAEITSTDPLSGVRGQIAAMQAKVDKVEGEAAGILELEAANPATQVKRAERQIAKSITSKQVQNILEGGQLTRPKVGVKEITSN